MKEQARKLITEWDEANGESWSDCSSQIAQIMSDFAKAQITKLSLIDYIKVWNKVRIEKWRDGDLHVYEGAAQELRYAVGDKPTIVWFSASNGPLFGFGSFFAIDENDEVIAERTCLIE